MTTFAGLPLETTKHQEDNPDGTEELNDRIRAQAEYADGSCSCDPADVTEEALSDLPKY